MAIDYTSLLTSEQKQNILNQRISQFAAEAWQHELNKQTCTQLGDEAGITASDSALATLEAAINVHQAELSALGNE